MRLIKQKGRWWGVVLAGYFFSFGLALVTVITFVVAYIGNFKVLVSINTFGEAHWELIMIVCVFIISVLGLYGLFKLKGETRV